MPIYNLDNLKWRWVIVFIVCTLGSISVLLLANVEMLHCTQIASQSQLHEFGPNLKSVPPGPFVFTILCRYPLILLTHIIFRTWVVWKTQGRKV